MGWDRFPQGTSPTIAKNLRDDLPVRETAETSEDREAARSRDAGRFEGPDPTVFPFLFFIGLVIVGVVILRMRGLLWARADR